jgi:hypothetical protein
MGDDATAEGPPLAVPLAAIEHPEQGRRLLPHLLGLLDESDDGLRLGASWAICRVVSADPDLVSYLVGRLLDRLEDDPSLEVELIVSYLEARYPDAVAAALEERDDGTADRRAPSLGPAAGTDPTRSRLENRPVGRTRLPGAGSDPGPRQVYTHGDEQSADLARDGDENRHASDDEVDETTATEDDPDPLAPGTRVGEDTPELLSLLTYESGFDSLSVVDGRTRTRYADVYRTLGVRDGDELGVGLALFHRPAEDYDRFVTELDDALDRWHAVAGHDNVVSLYDWGANPRPWAAAEYTDLTLAARGRLPPAVAHWNARSLADALAYCHENGVVHGGIDPGNVAYYGNVLDDSERQPPLLTNVGLMHAVRRCFDPTTRLDPRYAAPEYYERRYGRVDHATDVYHLGAVCYRLFTGQAPYDGEYDDVRAAILDGERRRPNEVADVPPGIDDVVTKAMATEKLRRYESVAHMRAELDAVGEARDDE